MGYGKSWLPVEHVLIALARTLPERAVKDTFVSGLSKAVSVPDEKRREWATALKTILMDELVREDVISHFAVAAQVISEGTELRCALRDWVGCVAIMSAENDSTQDASDVQKYEAVFGRAVRVIRMGSVGHTAALRDPRAFAGWVEEAMS